MFSFHVTHASCVITPFSEIHVCRFQVLPTFVTLFPHLATLAIKDVPDLQLRTTN